MTWRDDAECLTEDPDQFDADWDADPRHVAITLSICDRCQVRFQCLEEDLENDARDIWGIRGGLVQADRRRLRRRMNKETAA